jgi:hypothetical protein
VYILIISQEPIRDPEKNPLLEELEVVYIRGIRLYKELARLKKEAECDELNLLASWWSPLPIVCTGVIRRARGSSIKVLKLKRKEEKSARRWRGQVMSTDLIQVRFKAIPSCGWPVTGLSGPSGPWGL